MSRYKLNWSKAPWVPGEAQFVNIQINDGGILGQALITRMEPGNRCMARVHLGRVSAMSKPMSMREAKHWSEIQLEQWLVAGLEDFGYQFEENCGCS